MTEKAIPPPDNDADAGVPWHYGDPHREQRELASGSAMVDLSNRGVVTVSGPDRLGWLNDLTSQLVLQLAAGESAQALILDPHGHVEHDLHVVDDGQTTWMTIEPGTAQAVATYLESMKFMRDVTVTDVSQDYAVVWVGVDSELSSGYTRWRVPADYAGTGLTEAGSDRGGGADRYVPERPAVWQGEEVIVPRSELPDILAAAPVLAGSWAWNALRVAAAVPRMGSDTDHKTLPHEVGWIGPAVHLSKGCYRGQETVARVHNLGRPPRRLVLLHLDGSTNEVPAHGDEVLFGDRVIGQIGSVARHYELGPIATAIVKRSVPTDVPLVVRCSSDGSLIDAAQEAVVVG
ncbi:MAG: YgfZ/GcvT domain-containing protein [Candidatus Nanopelagicales bacterium]